MDALATLLPRQAGALTAEPAVEFDTYEQAAAAADRCPISCVCNNHTINCMGTGHSAFAPA
ncbi:hypothetical protein [Streptomyces boncukensis]|uniref:Uncharacterized protein n=1 Tax=Streptomyces boncukensis TaxID=2711219 RepID=A0A6G4X097_9ACTN|nr:hypothetical protein [Streptomyces boncukensis]NGO70966.1 hypothetical protein [Streptomyces boncukensis]